MNNQKVVLTALGCAGSLAAVLSISSSAIASPSADFSATASEDAFPVLVQNEESNPIIDALGCTCAVCTGGVQRPVL